MQESSQIQINLCILDIFPDFCKEILPKTGIMEIVIRSKKARDSPLISRFLGSKHKNLRILDNLSGLGMEFAS